jgi:hypothetical protein
VNIGRKGHNATFMAHCHQEMYHSQWAIILDGEFLEAYKHRMAIQSYDSVWCHFYPHIFTYFADYKEK